MAQVLFSVCGISNHRPRVFCCPQATFNEHHTVFDVIRYAETLGADRECLQVAVSWIQQFDEQPAWAPTSTS